MIAASLAGLPYRLAYPALFLLVEGESSGIPLPGETSLIVAAILASQGRLSLPLVIGTTAAAAIIGDNVGYVIGRKGARRLLTREGRWAERRRRLLERGEAFFRRHGGKTVFVGRWLPGLRVTAAWFAGAHRMPWWRFALWNALGGAAWATSVGLAAYFLGPAAFPVVRSAGLAGVAVVLLLALALVVWHLVRRSRSGKPAIENGASKQHRWLRGVRGRSSPRVRARLAAPLYALYTKRLRRAVGRAALPQHVAVILDGNRRWAAQAGVTTPGAGHRRGADKLEELVDWCAALGVSEVTVWALSNENRARSGGELEALYEVVADKLEALAERARRLEAPMRIRVFGRFDHLPERLQVAIARAAATPEREGLRLNIALGYSGRDELVDACRAAVRALAAAGVPPEEMAQRITREALAARLYTAGAPDPDLIIRTSGEVRLSGFLPWQSAHSEFYFTDVYWPALRELDFLRALRTFQQRQRRFGL